MSFTFSEDLEDARAAPDRRRKHPFTLHSPTFSTVPVEVDLGEFRVFQLIKWAFYGLSVFAVVTADDAQKDAMWKGAQAFGAALVAACSRDDGPCLTAAKAGTEKLAQVWGSGRHEVPQEIEPGTASYPPRQEEPHLEARHRDWRSIRKPSEP